MARLTFVVGKGGVGKTTVSCAYALQLAARRPRESILLISTDPAHSLADVLQVRLQSTPRRIAGKGKLSVWQIDAGKEFKKFLSGNRDAILQIVESGTFFSKEEIAPLLDTALPGMAEVAGLLAIQELLAGGKYGHIVVDTAPFGHTLRLFELPSHFQRFLNFLNVASNRDALLAERFGGHLNAPAHAFLERWEAMVRQVRDAFASKEAEIFLVTSPETFSLNEAVRSLQSLEEDESVPEMRLGAIVLNRVVRKAAHCLHCRHRVQAARKAEQFLKKKFPRVPVFVGPDPGNPILGIELLRRFGAVVFQNRSSKLAINPPSLPGKRLKFTPQAWPVAAVPLSFTVGKGGVGKTTTTAALAFHSRATQPGIPVTVCSTDPAPSLDDIFKKPIGNQQMAVLGDPEFSAMEVDSVSEFRRWAARITHKLNSELSMESGGLHVDLTFEKQVFAALMDVVPPGVDELFAIFRILDLLNLDLLNKDLLNKDLLNKDPLGKHLPQPQAAKVFIDMAPTGHALELLRMPERIQLWSRLLLKSLASHRTLALAQDVAVELASLGQQVRKLIGIMKDPRQSRIWAVMLPEPVPDHQTIRLLQAVEEMGLTVDSLFVNRVLIREKPDVTCKRCLRAWGWQLSTLQTISRKYRPYRNFLAPELPAEIAGAAALKKFTSKLWQIAD
ncbi:MAG TPA: ArsA family ATPase [Candidatus Angelobacter sp.]|nr:ArsA family ATPase [Candidatus Angelobacter sp.]